MFPLESWLNAECSNRSMNIFEPPSVVLQSWFHLGPHRCEGQNRQEFLCELVAWQDVLWIMRPHFLRGSKRIPPQKSTFWMFRISQGYSIFSGVLTHFAKKKRIDHASPPLPCRAPLQGPLTWTPCWPAARRTPDALSEMDRLQGLVKRRRLCLCWVGWE